MDHGDGVFGDAEAVEGFVEAVLPPVAPDPLERHGVVLGFGEEVAPEGEGKVIDLMEALKESLAKRVPSGERKPPAKAAPKRAEPAPARAAAAKKAQGGKK